MSTTPARRFRMDPPIPLRVDHDGAKFVGGRTRAVVPASSAGARALPLPRLAGGTSAGPSSPSSRDRRLETNVRIARARRRESRGPDPVVRRDRRERPRGVERRRAGWQRLRRERGARERRGREIGREFEVRGAVVEPGEREPLCGLGDGRRGVEERVRVREDEDLRGTRSTGPRRSRPRILSEETANRGDAAAAARIRLWRIAATPRRGSCSGEPRERDRRAPSGLGLSAGLGGRHRPMFRNAPRPRKPHLSKARRPRPEKGRPPALARSPRGGGPRGRRRRA